MSGLSVALVKDGEPLPQHCAPYPMRIGNLALELCSRGHRVCWYASTFSHHKKVMLFSQDTTWDELGFRQRFLYSGGYQRNISPQRWVHHSRFAVKLYKELQRCTDLDVIVCCIPMIEAALACRLVAKSKGIPLILDIRDPWPDVFLTVLPKSLVPLGRLLLYPYAKLARTLFKNAESVTACSQGFLDWAQSGSGRDPQQRDSDVVVYHGAHSPLMEQGELPAEWRTEPDTIRHAYIGGFGRNYVFHTMAEAILRLQSDPRHHFFFVGEGSEQHRELKSRLQCCENVTFTDWLSREEAYALGRSCQVGWLPLRAGNDGFLPNKPFEYAALGLAQVVGETAEVGSLLKQHKLGHEFQQNEPERLVDFLREVTWEQIEVWQSAALKFWKEVGDAKQCANLFADHVESLAKANR